MNGHGPPIKREGRRAKAALRKLTLVAAYRKSNAVQIFAWQREATRLFAEYWRTGQRSHIDAFAAHVIGMRERLTGGRSM